MNVLMKRLILILLLFSKTAFGQHMLDDFVARAMENSPTLKEYEQQKTLSQIQQKINRAENETFHASLTGDYLFVPYFNNHGKIITTNPSSQAVGYDINLFDGGLYSAQLNLERSIFNHGIIRVLEQQVGIQNENAMYNLHMGKHQLQYQVTEQYLNTYLFLLLSRLSKEIMVTLREQMEWTDALMKKGFTSEQDYLLLKVELKNQWVDLNASRQNYQSGLYQLYALCGIEDTTVVAIDSVSFEIPAPISGSKFLQKYALDSLKIVNQQQLFETQYQPKIDLFFNTGLNAVTLDKIERKFGVSAGLSLSLPLYDGKQKSLTRKQSQVNQTIIHDYRRFSESNIDVQRHDRMSRIQTLKKNIHVLEEQINDYRNLLALSETQLKQGHVSMIDHLTLLRNFVDIRKNKIETEIKCQLEINNYNYWNW